MNAILKEEPRDISEFKPDLSPALERVVRRCLEKNADQRFQTASDLGFALEELSGLSGTSTRRVRAAEIKAVRYRAFTPWLLLIPLMLLAFWLGTRINKKPAIEPSFERLTFRRGNVLHAHFAPDGKTVVYGASWEGRPTEIFLASPGIPESRPFGLQKADVLSVSKQGEMAILLRTGMLQALAGTGTLARVSMTGGVSPREVIDKVFDADWLPDGNDLVVIRQINRKSVLEFPIGNPIFESEKVLVGCRVSPDGQSVVFLELDAGKNSMRLLDRQGKEKLLIEAENIDIASWSPDGNKLWFTAVINARPGIYSMDTNGRLLNSFPITASMVVQDISPDGTILLEQELFQQGVRVKLQNQSEEHDLSWLDGSGVSDITPDGQYLLINETGHAGGTNYAFYLRKTDGSPAIKLGDGLGTAISADGKMVISRQTGGKLILVPTGAGSTQRISPQGWNCLGGAWMHGSLDEIVMLCSQPRRKMRLYRFNLRTRQAPTAISPEGDFGNGVFYSEGKYLLGRINGQIHVLPEKHPPFSFLPFITAEDREFLAWNKEGLFVRNSEEFPAKIYKIDASTGQRSLWKEISPADPTIIRIDNVILTPDTRNFAYTYARVLASDLYLFRGLQ